MTAISALQELAEDRSRVADRRHLRLPIRGHEHEIKALPADIILPDGRLDLYPDVLKLFRPIFDGGVPSIQCGGWVGYIPLNDKYALEVSPRVPIGNLERLIGCATGYSPRVLGKYTRRFAHSEERPDSLFDVLADQLLDGFDRIWENGLTKSYQRRKSIGSTPLGRIDPFETSWRSRKAGVPLAASTAFHRTADVHANRLLRLAFEKLLARYLGSVDPPQRKRALRIREALARLSNVARPGLHETASEVIEETIRHLPVQHANYPDALMLAQLIINDAGISIRGSDGTAILPSVIIDMAKVFEDYARRLLSTHLRDRPEIVVMDGNIGSPKGAKTTLFSSIEPDTKNVPVTPDIVIEVANATRLVIDAKYKPAPKQPERDDVNQVVLYGARYGAERVMLLYAGRSPNQPSVSLLGKVGTYQVYHARIDLNAADMNAEEARLATAIRALI